MATSGQGKDSRTEHLEREEMTMILQHPVSLKTGFVLVFLCSEVFTNGNYYPIIILNASKTAKQFTEAMMNFLN